MADEAKKCGICGVKPVPEGGLMCPECKTAIEARTRDPYAWMADRQKA